MFYAFCILLSQSRRKKTTFVLYKPSWSNGTQWYDIALVDQAYQSPSLTQLVHSQLAEARFSDMQEFYIYRPQVMKIVWMEPEHI